MAKQASRFSTVLRVKKHQEKLTQQQLVHIQRKHLEEKELLEKLQKAKDEAVKESYGKGRAKATDLQTHRAFIFSLSRQISKQTSKVHEIQEREEAKREELTKKAQARQMVEKLDAKNREETARAFERKDQQVMDDLAQRTPKSTRGRLTV